MLLRSETSQLLLIDIQDKLLPAMAEPEAVRANAIKLAKAARHFQCPMVVSEQYPKGIGHTDSALAAELGEGARIFEKLEFSAIRDEAIASAVTKNRIQGRSQVVICGIESHVCVLQTALEMMRSGFQTFCVEDAMSSRTMSSKLAALSRLRQAGVTIVTTEMVIFEWLGRAGTADFKALLPLIK